MQDLIKHIYPCCPLAEQMWLDVITESDFDTLSCFLHNLISVNAAKLGLKLV